MQQLDLFAAEQGGRRRRARRPRAAAKPPALPLWWPQLGLFDQPEPPPAKPWQEDETDDDPFVAEPMVHRLVPAHLTPSPQTSGIRSVFDLAATVLSVPERAKRPAKGTQQTPQAQRHGRTEREVGVTRHIAMRHDETEEWQERERQRRARQRVPKPVKAARTRGRKLTDLIGASDDD